MSQASFRGSLVPEGVLHESAPGQEVPLFELIGLSEAFWDGPSFHSIGQDPTLPPEETPVWEYHCRCIDMLHIPSHP